MLCSLILAVVNVIRLALKKQYLVSYPDPLNTAREGGSGNETKQYCEEVHGTNKWTVYCYCTYRHVTREALHHHCVCTSIELDYGMSGRSIFERNIIILENTPCPSLRSYLSSSPMGIFWEDIFCTCKICCFDRDSPSAQDKNLLLCSQIARSSAKQATSCSPMSLAPGDWARALFNCRTWVSSRWGRLRRELSDTHLPCTHIWTRCITRRVVASQPSLAAMSTSD